MSPLFVTAESRGRPAPGDPAGGGSGVTIDVHQLLHTRRQIAHIWSVEDVQEVRPDLDQEQAWRVLQAVDRRKDACCGITWETLSCFAESHYPEVSS